MVFSLPRRLPFVLCPLFVVLGCTERPRIQSRIDAAQPSFDAPVLPPDASVDVTPFFPDVPPPPDVPRADAPLSPDGPAQTCGNGVIELTESCDDGNSRPGDGCSGICVTEPNYTCPAAGQACVSLIVCGDGKIGGTESCDDANKLDGDGCSAMCLVEAGYACGTPGQPCTKVPTAACGDSVVNAGENCDDGNRNAGDCCSATCTIEPGCTCPMPGTPCQRDPYC